MSALTFVVTLEIESTGSPVMSSSTNVAVQDSFAELSITPRKDRKSSSRRDIVKTSRYCTQLLKYVIDTRPNPTAGYYYSWRFRLLFAPFAVSSCPLPSQLHLWHYCLATERLHPIDPPAATMRRLHHLALAALLPAAIAADVPRPRGVGPDRKSPHRDVPRPLTRNPIGSSKHY